MDVVDPLYERQSASPWVVLLAVLWVACAVGGLCVVWAYETDPRIPATAGESWPASTSLAPAADPLLPKGAVAA